MVLIKVFKTNAWLKLRPGSELHCLPFYFDFDLSLSLSACLEGTVLAEWLRQRVTWVLTAETYVSIVASTEAFIQNSTAPKKHYITDGHVQAMEKKSTTWRFSVEVTRWSWSMQLLYIEPG